MKQGPQQIKYCAKLLGLWLLFSMLFGIPNFASAQYSTYDIRPVNGNTKFAHTQTPESLLPVDPTALGIQYQWQSSNSPEGVFADVATGGTSASFTFSAPLGQTTYYRRRTSMGGSVYVFSNVVKYQVVSVNYENRNYVREHDVLVAGMSDWKAVDQLSIGSKLQTTTYVDGLGRPVQKVDREVSTPSSGTLWGDIVQFTEYDGFGRQPKNYLPFTTALQSGKYKSSTTNAQNLYYSSTYNESSAYTQNSYDNSPTHRVVNEKSPGTSWAAGIGNSTAYELNDINDKVRLFTIGYSSNAVPVSTSEYPVNTLAKIRSIDENNKQVIEYYDHKQQLILAKTQLDNSPVTAHTGWICTYSVYDDHGRLRYRFQPEAVKYLEGNSWSFSGTNGSDVLNNLCFRYDYDIKGRQIAKKAPGADVLYMLYDARDRLIFTQDGNQRVKSTPEWIGTIYDEFDRPIISFLYTTAKSRATLQADIDNAAEISTTTVTNAGSPIVNMVVDTRDIGVSIYAAQNSIEFLPGFESQPNDEFVAEINSGASSTPVTVTSVVYKSPVSSADLNNPAICTILKYSFYDNYSFSTAKSFNNNFDNLQAYPTGGDPIVNSTRTLSLPTGSLTRVIGTSTFLGLTTYYDDQARAIQSLEENIKSGIDITTLQYQFDGRILSTNIKHSIGAGGSAGYSVTTKNNYDKIGRVTGIEKKYGSNAFKTIAAYAFDDVGRLKTKRLDPGYTGSGKNELETLAYAYSIHSNIIGINKDYALKTPGLYSKWGNFFGYYLGYDNRDNVFAASNLLGRVTGAVWNTQGDDAQRKFDFSYDNAGRLINAIFNERQTTGESWSNAKMNFSVTGSALNGNKISYDLNGNLLNMLQKGIVPGNSTPVDVDNLNYTYANFSNRLLRVMDVGTLGTNNGKLSDFSDGNNGTANDYVYDENGNLVIDLNKNVKDLNGLSGKGIRYNHFDKPEEIRIAGKGVIKIVYDADGRKLQHIYIPEANPTSIRTTSYVNSFVYQGDNLQYIGFEEGRIRVVQAVNQNNGYDYLTMDGNMDLPGGARGAYDYFIRDYLGNVRMILTEQTHTGSNTATMETSRASNEEPLFGQVDENGNPNGNNEVRARFAVSSIPGQGSPGGGWTNNTIGNYVSRVGNLAGKKIGPNSLLKVMAGDEVSATSIYYYQNSVTNVSGTSHVTDVLGSLAQAIAGGGATSGLTHGSGAATAITGQLNGYLPFTSVVSPDANSTMGTNPKAYITVLFFDERFNFIAEGSTNQRVSQSGNGALPLTLANIKAPKNGYAYVYVSNESDEMVYFDNFQVTHARKHIIEENHYYAYGLRISGISSKKLPLNEDGHIQNQYLYNGKEFFEDADLDWYDYGFRMYDPQIGRFPQLDPLTDQYPYLTPYQYASCDPITNIDVDGLEGSIAVKIQMDIGEVFVTEQSFLQAFVIKNTRFPVKKLSWTQRLWSGVSAVGSLLEMGAGAAVGVVTSWTGVGAVIGGAAVVHGADGFAASITEALTGKPTETFTKQGMSSGLQAVGVNKETAQTAAGYADAGLGVFLSAGSGSFRSSTFVKPPAISRPIPKTTAPNIAANAPVPNVVLKIQAKLNLYPNILDPRTGRAIPLPFVKEIVPKANRVIWDSKARGEFIKQWIDKGYKVPIGGWDKYDIHHILPKAFGGTNDFWNLVPVERTVHQKEFNRFWDLFGEL